MIYAYTNDDPISNTDPLGLWAPPSLSQGFVDFSVGFGDSLNFGITALIRGNNDGVNKCGSGVDTHQSDEAFLFYARDPLTSHYITLWSGAAASNEEETIKDWTPKNAPNIPLKPASCFAWHVTKDRDK